MRETSILLYLAGGLMALGMVVFLATSAHNKLASAERQIPAQPAPAVISTPLARKPFAATWDFDQGIPVGLKMAEGKLEWQRHERGWGEGVFLPGDAKALVLPIHQQVPFVVQIQQRAYMRGGGNQFLGCTWSDGANTFACRQCGDNDQLERSYEPYEYRFIFVDQYMLMGASGNKHLAVAEFHKPYPGSHLVIMGTNSTVLRINMRELTPLELEAMRKHAAETVRNSKPDEWLLGRSLRFTPP